MKKIDINDFIIDKVFKKLDKKAKKNKKANKETVKVQEDSSLIGEKTIDGPIKIDINV